MDDNTEIKNLKTTLALERFAIERYREQIDSIPIIRSKMLLPGILTNEKDHERGVSALLKAGAPDIDLDEVEGFAPEKRIEEILDEEGFKAKAGFRSILEDFYFDLYFEKNAVKLYRQFAEESRDDEARKFFFDTTRSERGHVNIFQEAIEQIHSNQIDIEFYCPVCGWFISYGREPVAGNISTCRKCGVRIELKEAEGNFYVEKMSA